MLHLKICITYSVLNNHNSLFSLGNIPALLVYHLKSTTHNTMNTRIAWSSKSVVMFTVAFAIHATCVSPSRALPINVPTEGLVGYWSADGNLIDQSPTHNNGVLFNGAYSPGVSGEAFDFNGTSGVALVAAPDNAAYDFSSAMSVSFWFKGLGSARNVFIGQDTGAGTRAKWFVGYQQDLGGFYLHLNGPSFALIQSDPVTVDDGWNNFALVKDGSDYSFYLNGSSIGSVTDNSIFSHPLAPLTIGFAEVGFESDYFGYRGSLDEVALYNRALTAAEVGSLATLPVPDMLSTGALLGFSLLGMAGLRRTFASGARPTRRARQAARDGL